MTTTPDFYTIGYSGRTIEQFIATLHEADVKTLVDIRHLPLSRHKPDFSKTRLGGRLNEHGMHYFHLPALGIPSAQRKTAQLTGDWGLLWSWYDEQIAEHDYVGQLDYGIQAPWRPFALMCTEADPLACHRHRLSLALERLGLRGVDL